MMEWSTFTVDGSGGVTIKDGADIPSRSWVVYGGGNAQTVALWDGKCNIRPACMGLMYVRIYRGQGQDSGQGSDPRYCYCLSGPQKMEKLGGVKYRIPNYSIVNHWLCAKTIRRLERTTSISASCECVTCINLTTLHTSCSNLLDKKVSLYS